MPTLYAGAEAPASYGEMQKTSRRGSPPSEEGGYKRCGVLSFAELLQLKMPHHHVHAVPAAQAIG